MYKSSSEYSRKCWPWRELRCLCSHVRRSHHAHSYCAQTDVIIHISSVATTHFSCRVEQGENGGGGWRKWKIKEEQKDSGGCKLKITKGASSKISKGALSVLQNWSASFKLYMKNEEDSHPGRKTGRVSRVEDELQIDEGALAGYRAIRKQAAYCYHLYS